jgi:hypothetical protein
VSRKAPGTLVFAASPTIDSKADEPLGWVPNFDPHLGQALALAAALVRDPEALATLLEAAGAEAVDQVDRILRRLGNRLAAEIAMASQEGGGASGKEQRKHENLSCHVSEVERTNNS